MKYKDYNKYKIKSDTRVRELYYFAAQYPEWKDKLREITVIGGMDMDGMPKGEGPGNPTERIAIEQADLISKVNLIEQCVKDAGPDIYRGLLKGVTTRYVTPNWLRAHGFMSCGNDKYYMARRKFFWLLDQRKG